MLGEDLILVDLILFTTLDFIFCLLISIIFRGLIWVLFPVSSPWWFIEKLPLVSWPLIHQDIFLLLVSLIFHHYRIAKNLPHSETLECQRNAVFSLLTEVSDNFVRQELLATWGQLIWFVFVCQLAYCVVLAKEMLSPARGENACPYCRGKWQCDPVFNCSIT